MAITLSKQAMNTHSKPISVNPGDMVERVLGVIWFLVSFLLFIILGPFSAPIAMIALLQLGCEDRELQSPESIMQN
ncbi:hypothetical protein [Desulforhopalus sp. 52FAK]